MEVLRQVLSKNKNKEVLYHLKYNEHVEERLLAATFQRKCDSLELKLIRDRTGDVWKRI